MMPTKEIREMFPDWNKMEPCEWSCHSKRIPYGAGHFIEIGLYREPIEEEYEYSGRYTLQIFDGDDVIFCGDVVDNN